MERAGFYLAVAGCLRELPMFGRISDKQSYVAFGNKNFHIELRKDVGGIPFQIRFDFEADDQDLNLSNARRVKDAFDKAGRNLRYEPTSSKTWVRWVFEDDATLGRIPTAEETAGFIRDACVILSRVRLMTI